MNEPPFTHEPDPEHPGWLRWEMRDPDRYNATLGKLLVRREADDQVRVRCFPTRPHSNLANYVHGGALLGFIDVALFGATHLLQITAGDAVTLDVSVQFIGAARIDEPLDALVEVLRETRRLVFLRGLVVQEDAKVAAFAGTIRKASA